MSTQFTQDNSSPGTFYVPSEFYDCTRGTTQSIFEAAGGMAKSVPYEDGFISCPSALHRSVGCVNISGKDISVVLNRDKRVNKDLPTARENEKEINGFFLPNGESSHFNIPPFCYHVTVSEFVESENGGKKWLTREGFPLTQIQDQVITYSDGAAEGVVDDAISTGHLGHYAWVNNYTLNRIQVTVSKSATAYPQSRAQIQESKVSRQPDKGGEIVEQVEICAGATWHFKLPPRLYTMRALEPPSIENGQDSIMGQDSRVPAVTDYVQLCESNCVAGQIVVFLADTARNGGIRCKTYNAGELKLVSSTIVQTARVQYG